MNKHAAENNITSERKNPHMKYMHHSFAAWAVCFLFLLVSGTSLANPPGGAADHSSSHMVLWEKVKTCVPESAVSYPGKVSACKNTLLAFRVSGPLLQINVKPGDRVKKGQVLMQIDPQDFRDQIAVLDAQLAGAKSRLTTAKLDLQRGKTLFDQKVIPQADFDHMLNGRQIAWAMVSQVQAQLTIAKHHLAYTSLKAPYDGIIIDTTVENHEMVSAGRPVVKLHDISVLEVTAGIPENELIRHSLAAGAKAMIRFPALGDHAFSATLKEWKTAADPATKTFEVTFVLKAPETGRILPGMTAELICPDSRGPESVITVPTKAIIMDQNGDSMVWIYHPDTHRVSRQKITTNGFLGTNQTIVSQGLSGDETIITQGMDFITEDMDLASLVKQEDTK